MAKKLSGEPAAVTVKCDGKSRAWGAKFEGDEHEAFQPHPDCRLCYAPMGCFRCSGSRRELICVNCRDWAHQDGLDAHGRMLKTPQERADAAAFLRSLTAEVTQ